MADLPAAAGDENLHRLFLPSLLLLLALLLLRLLAAATSTLRPSRCTIPPE